MLELGLDILGYGLLLMASILYSTGWVVNVKIIGILNIFGSLLLFFRGLENIKDREKKDYYLSILSGIICFWSSFSLLCLTSVSCV